MRDRGPGIAEADLPHVFDRFYRAASARALPGSGLGLAIVKQAVDNHGGRVTVANAEGGGAVLTLRFDPEPNSCSLRKLSPTSQQTAIRSGSLVSCLAFDRKDPNQVPRRLSSSPRSSPSRCSRPAAAAGALF